VAQLVEALRYKPEGRGFDSGWCHRNFSLTKSFRPHYGPGVDSASNRNEYQKYFLEVKAAGAQGWQPYHLHVLTVLKSGSLTFLEPSGLVQACNGLALPLAFINWPLLVLYEVWCIRCRYQFSETQFHVIMIALDTRNWHYISLHADWSRNSPYFEPECSLPFSQQPITFSNLVKD